MSWYNRGKLVLWDHTLEVEPPVSLLGDVIKVALFTGDYGQSINGHTHFDDLSNELVATNYTSRGNALTAKTLAIVSTAEVERVKFDAADLSFASLGGAINGTVTQVVICREPDAGASASNTVLLASGPLPTSFTTSGGTVTIRWNAAGILFGA